MLKLPESVIELPEFRTAAEAQKYADGLNAELIEEGQMAKVRLNVPSRKWAIVIVPLEYEVPLSEIKKMIKLTPEEKELLEKSKLPQDIIYRAAWKREMERVQTNPKKYDCERYRQLKELGMAIIDIPTTKLYTTQTTIDKRFIEKYLYLIDNNAFIEPIIVEKHPDEDKYMISDGNHRARAFLMKDYINIPAVLVTYDKPDVIRNIFNIAIPIKDAEYDFFDVYENPEKYYMVEMHSNWRITRLHLGIGIGEEEDIIKLAEEYIKQENEYEAGHFGQTWSLGDIYEVRSISDLPFNSTSSSDLKPYIVVRDLNFQGRCMGMDIVFVRSKGTMNDIKSQTYDSRFDVDVYEYKEIKNIQQMANWLIGKYEYLTFNAASGVLFDKYKVKENPEICIKNIKQYLDTMIEFRKTSFKIPEDFVYNSVEHFVRVNGRIFKKIIRHKYPYGRKKECYKNAFTLMVENPELIYCEGFAVSSVMPLPIEHAWCVDKEFRVIDNTWDDGKEYYGVPFDREWVIERTLKQRIYGVIDNWEEKYPLLRDSSKDFLYVPNKMITCDRLRKTQEGEKFWQKMMENKVEISESEFLKNVNIIDALDEDEKWSTYKEEAKRECEPIRFYKSNGTYFFQRSGFEFIWADRSRKSSHVKPYKSEKSLSNPMLELSINPEEDDEEIPVPISAEMEATKTFRIPSKNIEKLRDEISKLSRKAEKLGAPDIKLTELSVEDVKRGDGTTERFHVVKIEGESPKLSGWTFIGILEPTPTGENILRSVPGRAIPETFRNTGTKCEHCGITRYRTQTYVVQDESRDYKQVGSSCLKDFLGGHKDPSWIVKWFTYLHSAMSRAAEATIGVGEIRYGIDEYLSNVVEAKKLYGWMSKTKIRKLEDEGKDTYGIEPTAHTAYYNMIGEYTIHTEFKVTPESISHAKDAIQWAVEVLPNEDMIGLSVQYVNNLIVIAKQDSVSHRDLPLAASLIIIYDVWLNKTMRTSGVTRTFMPKKEFIGKKGDSVSLRLKVVDLKSGVGKFGNWYLVKFVDEFGNNFSWFPKDGFGYLEKDKWFVIDAKVKGESEFRGKKETLLWKGKIIPTSNPSNIKKSIAEYRNYPNGSKMCVNCKFFDGKINCQVIEGIVSPKGYCKFWRSAALENPVYAVRGYDPDPKIGSYGQFVVAGTAKEAVMKVRASGRECCESIEKLEENPLMRAYTEGYIDRIDNPRLLGQIIKDILHNQYGLEVKSHYVKTVRPLDQAWYHISTFNSGQIIPNDIRKKAADIIGATGIRDMDDIQYGNIGRQSISMLGHQWKKFLKNEFDFMRKLPDDLLISEIITPRTNPISGGEVETTTGKAIAYTALTAGIGAAGSLAALTLYHSAISPKVSESKSYQRLIITVPHAKCPGEDGGASHYCDTLAKKFAKDLYRYGDRLQIGDVSRSEVDYNREMSEGTSWQNELTELIKSKMYDLLIDSHSFPNGSARYGENDVAILYNQSSDYSREVSENIVKKLVNSGFKAKIIVSRPEEDWILLKSVSLGMTPILIEVNENLNPQQLKRISSITRSALPKVIPAENPSESEYVVHAITYSCSGTADGGAEVGLCSVNDPKSNLWRHEWKKNRIKLDTKEVTLIGNVSVRHNGIGDYEPEHFPFDFKPCGAEWCKENPDSDKPDHVLGHLIKIEYLKSDGSSWEDGSPCSGSGGKPCYCGKKVKDWMPDEPMDLHTNKEGSLLFIVKQKPAENPSSPSCPRDFKGLDNVIVFWYMPGCGHCNEMKPFIDKVGLEVIMVNAYDCGTIADKHRISSTPTMELYRGGKMVKRHTGSMTKEDLKKWVSE